jgi:7-cyano-7-deazaguanine synthase
VARFQVAEENRHIPEIFRITKPLLVQSMRQAEKCVVVLSGGPDSTTVAYWAKQQGFDVYAISFNYGQIATKEVECAQKIADGLQVSLKVVDLSALKGIFGDVTSLCNKDIPMTSSFSSPIIVPFRNAIFLSAAVSYAVSICADKIFYGAQGSDEPFYPDCRREFYKAFEKAARLGTGKPISIEAPFNGLRKSELIKKAKELNVPLEQTWSCYGGGPKHCGICESCVNRKKAFKEANIADPTQYAQ